MEKEENKFCCRKCKVDKYVSEFIKDRTRKRGHHPYCRLCQNKIKNNKRQLIESIKWNRNNPEKRKIIQKRWYDKNPELVRIYKSRRRLRKKNQCDGTITIESLSKLNKEICSICNTKLDWNTKNSIHLDHIIPLSKGGMHSINNVQWTCRTCNLSKGNRI